ncbi:filamentous hemagglutinin N-terminal domain-containing protein [Rhizobium leguminosarum bv. viciae]|uniref:Filamentous hemagglutinin N-terminal domain-containing protein n=2 Tax=Rhizobium leguminosarum TaxID=384 RepID=A0A8I2GZ71_RHILV|nr:filamentous hemagglutinin N-terminal domain-containing protein [Rhizobium leguminosarum bv. viciae]
MVSVQLEKYNRGGIYPPSSFRARKAVMIEEQCKSTTATGGVAGTKGRPFRKAPYLARQSLALLLSALLVFQPMLANAQSVSASTTAPAANQPGVGTAPNGVPLIDIVTPNSKGLSHNKYDNFNVGTPGLILNNYKGEIGNSNLGGITPGNANLNTSGPASVILNEVISGNRSALNGPIEVFGGRADVVIANPNGITCDGCGFINTPHATLTTGVPDIGADGTLKGFTVNGGDVTIGTNGGNFAAGPGAVDLFDIVSRSVHVNGPVYGKDLRVTAGRNQFDYATGDATPLAATSGTPEYAIDGSALGAMQADRIKIVVTERGAGVRMRGDMAANAGEVSLSADGKISLGNVSGQQGVSISSKAKVTAAKVTSKAKVAVQADQGITLDTVAADGDIVLSSGSGLLRVGGEVNSAANVLMSSAAGIAAGSVLAGNALALSATSGDIQVAGAVNGADALTIAATSGSISAASLVSGNDLTLSAGADIGISGDILAQGNVTATGRSISAATLVAGVDLAATAQSANGTLMLQQAGSMSLTATNGSITAGNAMLSSGALSATATQNIAYGQLQSLSSAALTASGQISYGNPTSATDNLTLTTTNIDLSNGAASNITAGGTLTLNANSANLSNNSLTLGGLALNLSGTADLSGATINAVTSAGGSGDIAINAGGLSTSGSTALLAAHDLTLTLPSLTNAGQLAAGNDLTLKIFGDFTNSATGLAYAGHDAGLFIGGVLTNNQGAILAGNDLEIAGTTSGQRNAGVINISGLIQAGSDISILTSNLTNERATAPQWTTGTLVSSGVVSGFTLNPVAAGLPFGYLETADQNMYQLYAGVDPGLWQDHQPLLWSKATLADGTTYRAWTWISADGPEKVEPIIDWIRARVPRDANGNPVVDPNNPSRYFIVDEVNFSGSDESTTYSWDWSSHLSQSVYEDRLIGTLSPEATIRASGNLTIDATNLTNAYSSIEAGGNATLKGSTLNNTGVSLFRTTTTTCHAQGACTAYNANGTANPSKNIANGSTIVSSVQAIGGVSANIKAGGVLSVDYSSVNNTSAAGSMAGGASVAAASTPGDPLSALSGLTAGGALFNVNAGLGGAALAPPANPKSGGFGGKIAHQTFLFETRAAYLDVGTFYGSGYFMDKIGYQPETTVPFLGDAYFENQLIDTQLRQLVGEGLGRSTFIAGDSAIKQMKTLLDNGATYAKDHGLTVGQGLTPEQAAALTESIVLYQWQTVNGVQVLAPVVYVAAADRQKLSGAGAAMAGGSVNMNAGNLDNSGLIASAGGLTVSGSSIQGSGTFLSRGDTTLNATNGITLAAQTMTIGGQNVVNANAGVTAGSNLQLAGGGDLALTGVKVNATGNASLTGKNVTLAAAKVENDGQQNATGTQVASGGSLTIKATDNVNVIGSSAKAGTTLDVTADNGSVAVVSTDVARNNQSGYTKTLSTDQQQSQLSAGTNATIKAGDDILLSGSSVKAGGNVALSAGDDINITAAQEHSESTFGKKSASSITHVGSEISAGGDLSVTAGSGSGDHDLNIVGSRLAADGKVGLKADGDVTIAEATDTATLDTKLSIKGGFLGSSEKTTTHLETTTAVGSAITGGGGVDIESGKDTVISASKIEAGNEAGTANLNITTKGDLIIASGKDTSAKDDKGSRSGFLSKGSSSYESYDETTVASELGASGNINLDAGGAAVIAGSRADADGSINISGDSVSIIGAQETHELEEQRKKSGIGVGSGGGFISIYGSQQNKGAQASTLNVGSALSAGEDVNLTARATDLNIMGSSVDAERDINLSAARDVNVTPGAESFSQSEEEKKSGFGLSFSAGNGGFSVGIGAQTSKDNSAQQADTNAASMLSAGRDLNISAGNNVNLQAAQASAERDVNLFATKDINLLSANDVTNYQEVHEKTFAGVTLTVSSQVGQAAESIVNSAERLTGDSRVNALTNTAIAALGFYQGYTGLKSAYEQYQKDGSIGVNVALTVGASHQESGSSSSSSTPVVTDIRAGHSVTMNSENGSITSDGTQMLAGYDKEGLPTISGDPLAGDIILSAKNGNINLNAVTGTSNTSSENNSWSAAVGVGAQYGAKSKSADVGLVANASYGEGSAGTTGVNHFNTHITGIGDVTILTNDLALKGATVTGGSITAAVRNLTIESLVDTATAKANQFNVNASTGFGSTSVSGVVQKGAGDAAVVSEQSGIHAGTGGLYLDVAKQTTLLGGLITSNAAAALNIFSTGTLTVTDIDTHSAWKANTFGASIGTGGLTLATVKDGENKTGQALSAIGANIPITITDPAHQIQDIGAIRRDTENTNTSLPGLPDLENILRDQYKTQADLQAAQKTMATLVGDIADGLRNHASTQAEHDFWDEGGQGRALLHAIGGGILGGVNGWEGAIKGALGAGAATLMAPAIASLVKGMLKDSTLSAEDKQTLATLIGATLSAAVGGAIGGGEGAGYGAAEYQYNYLYHHEKLAREKAKQQLDRCIEGGATCTNEQVATLQQQIGYWDQLDTQRDTALTGACDANPTGPACVAAITDALRAVEYLRDPADPMMNPSSVLPGGYTDLEMRLVDGRYGGLSNQELAAAVYAERIQTIELLSEYADSVQAALHANVNQSLLNAALAVFSFALTEKLGQVRGRTNEETVSGCSFDGSTLVKTIDGFTAISQIRPGKTLVWSRDEQGREGYKLALAKIQERHEQTLYLTVKSDTSGYQQTIITTTNHPFFAVLSEERAIPVALPEGHRYQGPIKNGAWVAARDLRPGERLSDADGSWSSVVNIRVVDRPLDAYNLTIANFHTYFVKQATGDYAEPVWVHNECRVPVSSFEQARNEALDLVGTIDPATRTPFVAKNVGGNNALAGKVVGFEGYRPDGTWVRMRMDWDPVKGAHINTQVGKGVNAVKTSIEFPGTVDDVVRYVNGNFSQ